jgi:hypothetical protein
MYRLHVCDGQVLTVAGLVVGVASVDVGGVGGSARAGGATLQPVAGPSAGVLTGGAAPAEVPRRLAVRVLRTGVLPAGTRITVTFDRRLYAPLASAVVTLDREPVAAGHATVTDPDTGEPTSTVTLTGAVCRGELIVVVGTANPLHPTCTQAASRPPRIGGGNRDDVAQ